MHCDVVRHRQRGEGSINVSAGVADVDDAAVAYVAFLSAHILGFFINQQLPFQPIINFIVSLFIIAA